MTAYIKFQDTLKKLEDKGYVQIRLVNDYWHYKLIFCEQESIVNKLKEYLDKIDKEDYFYGIDYRTIYLFDTRVFINDFDTIAMEHESNTYFTWDELEKNGGRNYSFYYPLRKVFMSILKPKGYEFEHPHGSAYCHCVNRVKINKQKEIKEKRKKEIDDFLNTL